MFQNTFTNLQYVVLLKLLALCKSNLIVNTCMQQGYTSRCAITDHQPCFDLAVQSLITKFDQNYLNETFFALAILSQIFDEVFCEPRVNFGSVGGIDVILDLPFIKM
jgi:hypothetical protein